MAIIEYVVEEFIAGHRGEDNPFQTLEETKQMINYYVEEVRAGLDSFCQGEDNPFRD